MKKEIIVLGGGPAGYVGAITASRLGAKVRLIEKDSLGGTCLNRGCIPTKAFFKSAAVAKAVMNAEEYGVRASLDRIDLSKIVARKNGIVKTLSDGVGVLCRSNHIDVIKGAGTLEEDGKVYCDGKKLSDEAAVLVCTGSQPAELPVPGAKSPFILNSTQILDADEIPEELLIVGGGVIGVEMAQAFSAFGSRVTIVESQDSILSMLDEDISRTMEEELAKTGIVIYKNTKVEKFVTNRDTVTAYCDKNREITADRVLVSVGRNSMSSQIRMPGMRKNGGRVAVDDFMETSIPGVFAPGDINGRLMLAHAAFKMGEAAAHNAAGGQRQKVDLNAVPCCVYGSPEAASIGVAERSVPKERRIKTGLFPFSANGRARIEGRGAGFVKFVCDCELNKIIGVHIIGPFASELINEASALISLEATADEMCDIIHAHPTCAEALMEAAADALGKATHLPKRE